LTHQKLIMTSPKDLPQPQNVITVNTLEGKATFKDLESDSYPIFKQIGPSPNYFADLHTSETVPVALGIGSKSNDLELTLDQFSNNKNVASLPPQGAVFRRTDLAPGSVSPFHRTLTLNYQVVVQGAVELVLDSGESRILKVGDTIVQRATMYQVRNLSGTEWARMVWVMLPIQPLLLGEKELKAEYRPPVPAPGG
jgi:quercetin dioxygenase-like cupin family protein